MDDVGEVSEQPPVQPMRPSALRVAGIGLIGVFVGILVMLAVQRRSVPVLEVTPAPTAVGRPNKVYVTGAVDRPGVYPFEPGERATDVVGRAGGLADDADELRVNLALRLRDEMHLHVPIRPAPATAQPGIAEPPPVSQPALPPGTSRPAAAPTAGVNVNGASTAELEALPGIGSVSARKIVEYRTLHGRYRSLDDLRLAGVNASLLRRAADFLTFD